MTITIIKGDLISHIPPVYNLIKKGNQMQDLMPSVKFNFFSMLRHSIHQTFSGFIVDAISYHVDYLCKSEPQKLLKAM